MCVRVCARLSVRGLFGVREWDAGAHGKRSCNRKECSQPTSQEIILIHTNTHAHTLAHMVISHYVTMRYHYSTAYIDTHSYTYTLAHRCAFIQLFIRARANANNTDSCSHTHAHKTYTNTYTHTQ